MADRCQHGTLLSPLTDLLPERTTPELQYLATKAAAMESYARAVGWLEADDPAVLTDHD